MGNNPTFEGPKFNSDVGSIPEPTSDKLLADGCYFLAFGLSEIATSLGTMRVTTESGKLFVSADLYSNDAASLDDPPIGQIPPPGAGVPIFPIADYSYYLRFTKIEPADGGLDLAFEVHQFIAKAPAPFDGAKPSHWRFERTFTAHLSPAAAPAGYPKPDMFFVGNLTREDTSVLGFMQIGWVSDVLRRAVIKIDRVTGSEAPEDNGAGVTWKSVFDPIGWDVGTIVGPDTVTKKDGKPAWLSADAATAFAALCEGGTLDTEWRYHILVVPLMAQGDTHFGFMYVRGDERARTDLFMASDFIFPDTEPQWGPSRPAKRQDVTFSAPRCMRSGMRWALAQSDGLLLHAANRGDRAGGDCRGAVPVEHHVVIRSGGRAPASPLARHLGASGRHRRRVAAAGRDGLIAANSNPVSRIRQYPHVGE